MSAAQPPATDARTDELDAPRVQAAAEREYAQEIDELQREVAELEARATHRRDELAHARRQRDDAAAEFAEWQRHAYPSAIMQICSALQSSHRLWLVQRRHEARY